MRKENADFHTAFISEEGSKLLNRDYFAYVELDNFACYVAADSLDEEREKNSAKLVVECILREFTEHPSMTAFSIKRNLKKAHRELLEEKEGIRLRASVSLVVTNYVKLRYATAGNSRFNLMRNGRVLLESKDQSLTENMVEAEEIPMDKAAMHEERNNLYSYLGQNVKHPRFQVSRKKKLVNGDIFNLYTRGIWENCDNAELLDASKEVSKPQELVDNVEELILGKQKEEIDNYTMASTFVDKVYLNPKKRWTPKRILAIVLPIAIVLLILGIGFFVRYRIREGKREDMEQHMQSAAEYMEYENFEKAAEEYKLAKELAGKIKQKDMQEKIENILLLTDQILLADKAMEKGDYEKALELYLQAKKLASESGGIGADYMEDRINRANDYMEIFELLESGENKEDYGDYAGAIEAYKAAKKKASALYDKETKAEALEKQRAAEEALEQLRQEELDALEKNIQDAIEKEQVAQELENQSLINDKKNALELESKGNELMKKEDYLSAITYFETARGMYENLDMPDRAETLTAQIEACRKLAEEAKKKAEQDAAQQAADAAAIEDAKRAAEEAKKAAEEAKKAAEESKKDDNTAKDGDSEDKDSEENNNTAEE